MARKATTRNAQGSGSIRQRPDGRWEARFTVGIDPGTGKQIQKSVYAETQQDVRRKLTEKLREVDTGTYRQTEKMKLGEWLDEWYQNFCLGILKPYTCVSYETIIRRHIKPALGAVRLSDLSTSKIQKMVQGLHEQKLSAKTIKNVHACLSAALEQAKADGKIASNPCEFVKLPKLIQKEINALSVPQMSALLDAAAGDEFERVIYICLFCGLRKGEALGLSWKQVDFEKNRLTISQQLQRLPQKDGGWFIADSTKNGKTRYIDAPPFVMDVLKEVQRQQLLNRIKAGKAWRNEWDLVFTNDLGEHLQLTTMHTHFKKIAAAAGVPDARVHDLRHSFATLSLANGDDVKTVQSNLGHATAAFTLQKYIHASEQMKLESANRMQTFFDQNLKKA